MNSVSDNYISDVVYGSFYNEFVNPLNLHYIALHAGLRHGKLESDFRFCDLGCGDGTILNIIASMYPKARFYGVDFNETHINTARERARKASLDNVEYRQLDFLRLNAKDFPQLDFIICFGTFSWINIQLQDRILTFAGESLADRGVFSVHYAAKPGKAQIDSLWHLMRTVTSQMNCVSTERARAGVELIGILKDKGARFFMENPVALARSNALPTQDVNYLAHEALTEWQAFHHSEIAERARNRGLQYAGLQEPGDNDTEFTISEKFRPVLDNYSDPVLRSTIEDYILNRGLRNDIYVKTQVSDRYGTPGISSQPMLLVNRDGRITRVQKVKSGKAISFEAPVYEALEDEMRLGVCTIEELHGKPGLSSYNESELVAAIARLVASGQVKPVIGNSLIKPFPPTSGGYQPALKITREILSDHIQTDNFTYLPSPLIGQCFPVDQLIALSLSALLYQPHGSEKKWVADQIRKSGVAGIRSMNIHAVPEQADIIANQVMQATTGMVLPALVRLGVYTRISQ